MTNLYDVANSRRLLDVKFLLPRRDSSSFKMMGTIHRKTRRWAYSNSNTLALNARKRDKVSQRLESFLLGRFFLKRSRHETRQRKRPLPTRQTLVADNQLRKSFFLIGSSEFSVTSVDCNQSDPSVF